MDKPSINLVIPGGATHVIGYAGAAYELTHKFQIARLAGVSAGAIVSALLAFDIPAHEAYALFKRLLQNDALLDSSIGAAPRFGKCKWERVAAECDAVFGPKITLGEAHIPLTIVVTDMWTSSPVFLSSETHPKVLLREALAASSAILPIASAQEIASYIPKRLFIDGGFTDNRPDDLYDDCKEPTIVLCLNHDEDHDGKKEDVLPVRPWDFMQAAKAIVRCMLYASGAKKSARADLKEVWIEAKGDGLDFSLDVAEISARWAAGKFAVAAMK